MSFAPDTAPAPYLQLTNISKRFGRYVALRDVYLDVYPGEFICLLGPSGCGKTTLLRIIAGLEQQDTGQIVQDGRDISALPPAQRDFGIVFQSYALFPNLTAAQNVAYGLENTPMPRTQVRDRVAELLATVGLSGMENKYPAQLSGGQQQRVALARALALSPGLLLLDEPLSALDAKVRASLRAEIRHLQQQLGVTTVMVTHDQEEALSMADRIVVMDKGYLAQIGTPRAIYQQPNTPFVADFIGVMNFIPGLVATLSGAGPEGTFGEVRCGPLVAIADLDGFNLEQSIQLAIRPEDVQCWVMPPAETANLFAATVTAVEFLGSSYRLLLQLNDYPAQMLVAQLSANDARASDVGVSRPLHVQLPPHLLRAFAAEAPAAPAPAIASQPAPSDAISPS